MYIYESHMGGIYTSPTELTYEQTHCSQCGDNDWLLGDFNSAEEFLIKYADDIDCNDGHGGCAIDIILEDLAIFDDCPDTATAIEIVRRNREDE